MKGLYSLIKVGIDFKGSLEDCKSIPETIINDYRDDNDKDEFYPWNFVGVIQLKENDNPNEYIMKLRKSLDEDPEVLYYSARYINPWDLFNKDKR